VGNVAEEVPGSFDDVEEEFHAFLDESLGPQGPESLYDLVTALAVPAGAFVVDVGCGRGQASLQLAARFGYRVLGIDPTPRQPRPGEDAGIDDVARDLVQFAQGKAEAIPAEDASVDLLWCRESLMFADLAAAAAEFNRVLRPGGHVLAYQVLRGPELSDVEAEALTRAEGGRFMRPDDLDEALTGAGLVIHTRVDYSSEWGERAQEREGTAGKRLLYAARLRRDPQRYITRFGQSNYDIMLMDCLWHVYRLIGKLAGYACVATRP